MAGPWLPRAGEGSAREARAHRGRIVISLTPRQGEVLDYIDDRIACLGVCPTVREIAAAFGWTSTNGVADHLWALERKGYIRVEPNSWRGISVLKRSNGRAS